MPDFEALALPDTFELRGVRFKGQINKKEGKIIIPCLDCPDLSNVKIISQILPHDTKQLNIIDFDFSEGHALDMFSGKPNMLTVYVDSNLNKSHGNISIGAVNGTGIQIGNSNSQNININLQQLVQEISESNDVEAKSKLKELLENSTVASIIGIGITNLITLL